MTVRDSDGSRLDPPGDWDSLRELLVAAVGERCLDSVLDLLEFHRVWWWEEAFRHAEYLDPPSVGDYLAVLRR